jgi:CubicO group peptidase (beta-lactamase class C family)
LKKNFQAGKIDGDKWNTYTGGEYGYGWWINTYYGCKIFFTWGANEQYIFVTPSLNLVAVFNSNITAAQAMRPPEIYAEFIVKQLADN